MSGAVAPFGTGWRDGHQLYGPSMAIRAGSMSVRTTNVSRSTDETSTRPSWLMDTVLVRKRPEKAKVMMSPAAEMTPADATRPSRIASRSERPLRRSSCGLIQGGKIAQCGK